MVNNRNNRLSYTLAPEINQIFFLEENNYYPFGLKHGGYNTTKKDISYNSQVADPTSIMEILPEQVKFKYYYQEQERQDELGLNWDSFKYRNYDYAIGRFMSVDPLAEKYAYNSVYNFSENRVLDARELEGLEKSIAIYGPNNSQTILNRSQYDPKSWSDIQQAYFNMTRNIKGGKDWIVYSNRENPPELGTLSLYYGENGVKNAFYEKPGNIEQFNHSLNMGARAWRTFFIYSDPHVEGSAASVKFTNNMVQGTAFFSSFFIGGEFALAGKIGTAKKIQRFSALFSTGYSLTQSGAAYNQGDYQKSIGGLLSTGVSYGTSNLFNTAINANGGFTKGVKLILKSISALESKLIGSATKAIFDDIQSDK